MEGLSSSYNSLIVMYKDLKNGGDGKMTTRQIAEVLVPKTKWPINNTHRSQVRTALDFSRHVGWVKLDEKYAGENGAHIYKLSSTGKKVARDKLMEDKS